MNNRQVAIKWLYATKRVDRKGENKGRPKEKEIQAILKDKQRIAELRQRLSSISWFVRLMCQTVARQCNLEDECTGRFFEERFKLHKLEEEADVLACLAYVDLNPLRAGLADSLDARQAQVSIGDRLRDLGDRRVDASGWLAPLELAEEVDGQPVAVTNDMTLEDVQERRRRAAETLGSIPMRLEDYTALLWHLALESRPELQARCGLKGAQLRGEVKLGGRRVDLDALKARLGELGERCDCSLGQHACKAIRARLEQERMAAAAQPSPPPRLPR